MSTRRHRSARIGGTLLALALVAGCGGGSDSGDTGSPEKPKASEKPDYEAAATAVTELSEAYQQVYDADIAAQRAVVAYFKAHPNGDVDAPAVEAALEKLEPVHDHRDEVWEEMEDLSALQDPDVKAAFDAFKAKAEQQDAFNDGYYEGFAAFRGSLSTCRPTYTVVSNVTSVGESPTQYGKSLLKHQRSVTPECVELLDELVDSENTRLAAYATAGLKVIQEHRAVFTDMARGKASVAQATSRYIAASKRWNKSLNANTKFEQEMKRLNASQEFGAFSDAVKAKQKDS